MSKRRKIRIKSQEAETSKAGLPVGEIIEATVVASELKEIANISEAVVDALAPNVLAPVAEGIHDKMTFDEAFGLARGELGAGAVFFWRGNVYGTYLQDEWEALSNDEKQAYWQSLPHEKDDEILVADIHVESLPAAQDSNIQEAKGEIVDESIEIVSGEIVESVAFQEAPVEEEESADIEDFDMEDHSSPGDDLDWVDW